MTISGPPARSRWSATLSALALAALAVGIALRVSLALVNAEANDPHLPVIAIMAFEDRIPAKDEAWEAFQPKLYHATTALVWRLMPTRDPFALARAAQLVSCAAGVLTLMLLLRFLHEQALPAGGLGSAPGPAVAFMLAALSPALIGVSAQATNDAFVILFSSLALYFGIRFFERGRALDFTAMSASVVAAGLSKGNGLVIVVAVAATFAIAALTPLGAFRARRRAAGIGALFVVLVVPAIAAIGPYAGLMREFGSPFVTNWHLSPRPHLFRETLTERPGLTSIAHGLLTFRLADLLRHPGSTYHPSDYPRHRTSLWTRAYAHAHSLRFEAWPPSWVSRTRTVRTLTRVLFVTGLVPALMLLAGAVETIRRAAQRWRANRRPRAADVLLLLAVGGSLAFVALYSVRLRDYSSMKLIFAMPALLGFVALAAVGGNRWACWIERRQGMARRIAAAATGLCLAILLAGYVMEAGLLIRDLRARRPTLRPPALDSRAGMTIQGPVSGAPTKVEIRPGPGWV